MPGKPLTNTVFVVALYAAVVAVRKLRPGQFMVEATGRAKYVLLVVMLLGLFLDELPAAIFLILAACCWRHIFPRELSARQLVLFVRNGLFLALPLFAFAVIVLAIAPPLTEYLHGYRFNYLSEVLLTGTSNRTGTSFLVGPYGPLTAAIVVENVSTLFGLSLAPHAISPLLSSDYGEFPDSRVTNLPKLLILLAFFGATLWIAIRARGTLRTYLRGFLVGLVLFLLFLDVLSIRHLPLVTGYYYGAGFASLFAILIGMLFSALSTVSPRARSWAALAVLWIVGTQIVNFWPINDGWRHMHDEVMLPMRLGDLGAEVKRKTPIVPGRLLSAAEVNAI